MSMNFKGKFATDFGSDKGYTVQSDRDEADINKIIARFEKSGTLPRGSSKEPFYGDVSEFSGLAESIAKVKAAEQLFMGFDAGLRERFDNDPVKMISFLEDTSNLDEAIELGLIEARPVTEPRAPEVPGPLASDSKPV